MFVLRLGYAHALLACGVLFTTAGTLGAGAREPAAAPRSEAAPSHDASGISLAEVRLPAPTRYAVVHRSAGDFRTLHTRNEVVFDPGNPSVSFTITAIEPGAVTLRDGRDRTRVWRVGRSLTAIPGLKLEGVVTLDALRYEYHVVERITQPEPVVIRLEGTLAVLAKQVLPPAKVGEHRQEAGGRARSAQERWSAISPTMSQLMQAKEVEANTYELDAPGLRPSLGNVGQVISDLHLSISPSFGAQTGIGFQVSSALADGVVNQGGFTVTNSKAAEVFGIQVGDTVLQINDQPVNSPMSAWWAYQELLARGTGDLELRVGIRRGDAAFIKVFRIR